MPPARLRPDARPRAPRALAVLAAAALLLASAAGPLAAQAVATAPTAAAAPAARTHAATTIILVRHAEKAAIPSDDPPLSPVGEARSLALLDALREAAGHTIGAGA